MSENDTPPSAATGGDALLESSPGSEAALSIALPAEAENAGTESPVVAPQAAPVSPPEAPVPDPVSAAISPSPRTRPGVSSGVMARGLVFLSVAAAAATLFAITATAPWAYNFLTSNQMDIHVRHKLINWMFGVSGVCVVTCLVLWWRLRARAVALVDRLSRITAPLVALPLLPAFWLGAWTNPVLLALYLAVFVLLLEWTLRHSFAAWWLPDSIASLARRLSRPGGLARGLGAALRRWGPLLVVLAGAATYAYWSGKWTIISHRRFLTSGYDLGQYDNLFWNTLQGDWLRVYPLNLEKNWSGLRNHADLGAFLLLPFYAIRPNAETLLIIQACILGSGAIAVYLFASRHLGRPSAMFFGLGYLLYAPLASANFYDFHFQPIAAVFILFAIYFVDARRFVLFWIFFIMAMSCREDIPIGLTVLGLFLWLSGARPKTGFAAATIAATYFVLMRFVIMPSFGTWWFSNIYRDLYPEGDGSFGGVVKTLITNPTQVAATLMTEEKLRYTLQILAPLVFLPLRRSYLWIAIVPGFILAILTTRYDPTTKISFQYVGHFIAYLFPAAVLAVAAHGETRKHLQRAAVTAVFVGTLLSAVSWGALHPKDFIVGGFQTIHFQMPLQSDLKRHEVLQKLADLVPAGKRLAVADRELPHVSNRAHIYTLRDSLQDADYLLYSKYSSNLIGYGGTRGEEERAKGTYTLVKEDMGLVLLKKAPAAPKPAAPAPALSPPAP